jgi:hypothetical protein
MPQLFDTKKVFNPNTFALGTAVYVIGYDDEGTDLIGNFVVRGNEGEKLILTGVSTAGRTRTRYLYLEWLEVGMVKIHVYEQPSIPFPHPEPVQAESLGIIDDLEDFNHE